MKVLLVASPLNLPAASTSKTTCNNDILATKDIINPERPYSATKRVSGQINELQLLRSMAGAQVEQIASLRAEIHSQAELTLKLQGKAKALEKELQAARIRSRVPQTNSSVIQHSSHTNKSGSRVSIRANEQQLKSWYPEAPSFESVNPETQIIPIKMSKTADVFSDYFEACSRIPQQAHRLMDSSNEPILLTVAFSGPSLKRQQKQLTRQAKESTMQAKELVPEMSMKAIPMKQIPMIKERAVIIILPSSSEAVYVAKRSMLERIFGFYRDYME